MVIRAMNRSLFFAVASHVGVGISRPRRRLGWARPVGSESSAQADWVGSHAILRLAAPTPPTTSRYAAGIPLRSTAMIPHNKDVEAELAIRHLAASYTDAVNRLSPEDAAEVWAPDGVLIFHGREVAGKETLLKAYRRTFSSVRLLFQMSHSGMVVVDGDRARCRWWLSELSQALDSDGYNHFYGLYQDEVVRTDIGWRFARRQLDTIRSGPFPFEPGEPKPVPPWFDLDQ